MGHMKRYYEEMTDDDLVQFMRDIAELDAAYARAADEDDKNYHLWLQEQDSSFDVMIEDDSVDYYELRPY